MASVVVGIDGTEASRAALRWAADEAKLRDAALRVVHTWDRPYSVPGPHTQTEVLPPSATAPDSVPSWAAEPAGAHHAQPTVETRHATAGTLPADGSPARQQPANFCTKCGSRLVAGDRFCTACGVPLDGAAGLPGNGTPRW